VATGIISRFYVALLQYRGYKNRAIYGLHLITRVVLQKYLYTKIVVWSSIIYSTYSDKKKLANLN
jgi:hypothetical protein